MSGSALEDRPAEQAFCRRHRQQRRDAERPGGLAEYRDIARITAEGGDVLLHPLQGRHLVEQSAVGTGVVQEEEAVAAETVVNGHAYDAVAREAVPGVLGDGPGAVHERASVYPHHDREAGAAGIRGPDVQVQAVVAGYHRIREKLVVRFRVPRLGDCRTVCHDVPDTIPCLWTYRRPHPVRAERWSCVGDPPKRGDPVGDQTTYFPVNRLDHGLHRFLPNDRVDASLHPVIHPDYGACRNTLPGTSKARMASRAGKPLSSWLAEAAAS